MREPIIVPDPSNLATNQLRIAASGQSFEVHEWSGSGPDYLHVHYADDAAWHVLEGALTFCFIDKQIEGPGWNHRICTGGCTTYLLRSRWSDAISDCVDTKTEGAN